ncbi:MAG: superoxide dismutase [Saprospiraceae bacterium]|nr:superoxide dismutase [Saprospiraceae bacterium]MBK8081744.1 superoxide dismutase [Saprospiraceae bacterium]MBK8820107.1 superoxide dismutase [Saprospiraceae bacterium]MBK8854422.1 superoxide dismutase [Saprospiraceae bacterium]MBK9044620.1 superoxide dismutase [Saprospiraceae bacterium]
MAFELPALGYSYDALEPHFDARTMEIHHTKHHAAYTTNLNNAIANTPLEGQGIKEILKNLDMNNNPVRNNGGGYYNHNMFWQILHPENKGRLSGPLLQAIEDAYGSKETFMEKFAAAAMTRFGSGWAWLCVHPGGKVEICSSANQDNPIMPGIGCGGTPILGLDVWEHAYYLHYQNRRADYVAAFWNVLNWNVVEDNYNKAK